MRAIAVLTVYLMLYYYNYITIITDIRNQGLGWIIKIAKFEGYAKVNDNL